jgi:hypothetical protein
MPIDFLLNPQTITPNQAALSSKSLVFNVASGLVQANFTAIANTTGLIVRQNDFSGVFYKKATALGNTTEVFVPYGQGRVYELGLPDADRTATTTTAQIVASGLAATLSGVSGVIYFFNTGEGTTPASANQRSLNFEAKIFGYV